VNENRTIRTPDVTLITAILRLYRLSKEYLENA